MVITNSALALNYLENSDRSKTLILVIATEFVRF